MQTTGSFSVIQPRTWLRGAAYRLRAYWTLIKSLQTGLLILTAVAGYVSGCCLNPTAGSLAALLGSLFLAVSGSTVLNMVYDRDIDARMRRTAHRPLPSGQVTAAEALAVGLALSLGGLGWSFSLDLRYGAVVLAGVLLDVLVYTMLLKRRTAFSILLGGLSGGMPALAGRVLAVGEVDLLGGLLALGVLLWIPTHIMTFSIKYAEDYWAAGLPTFPTVYGVRVTRWIIAGSTVLSVLVMVWAGAVMGVASGIHIALAVLGVVLVGIVLVSIFRPTPGLNFMLYKGASIYMLLAMLFLIAGGL